MIIKYKTNFNQQTFIIVTIILFSCFLRILYIYQFDGYFDDWNFFFTVDPNVSDDITWQRHYFGDRGDGGILPEDYPWVFTYFTKYYLKIIGYSVENILYFLFFFSFCSFFFLLKICNYFTRSYDLKILVTFLFGINLFLIRETQAFRPHSLSILLSLISLYYFFKIFLKNKYHYKNISIYIFSTVVLLLVWPLNLAFFFGQIGILFFFLIQNNFQKSLEIFLIVSIILILYLLLNANYLEYQVLKKTWHYTQLDYKFFFNYFFRSFFGSIIMGGIMLILFVYFFINDLKDLLNKSNRKIISVIKYLNIEHFFLIIIFIIYLSMITYTLIRASVMAPKYILVLLPLILVWTSVKIINYEKKNLKTLIIILMIVNSIIFWKDIPISRPPIKELISILVENGTKNIITTESLVFNQFSENYNSALKHNIKFYNIKDINKIKISQKHIAFVCMNNPRFAVGSLKKKDEDKCKNIKNNNNIIIIKEQRITDFIIYFAKI